MRVGKNFDGELLYLKRKHFISFLLAAVVTYLYLKGYIVNVKENVSNIIALSAAIMVLVTLVLTLLLYLNDKDEYREKIGGFLDGKKRIFGFVFEIICFNMFSIIILIFLSITIIKWQLLKYGLVLLDVYFFTYNMFGAVYMLWFTLYIVIGLEKKTKKVK